MSSVKISSGSLTGLDSIEIHVEVDSTPGLYAFSIVGLPDKSVEESKDRVSAALKNCGFVAPKQKNRKVVVNLAPADVKKQGPSFDLPIALGYLLSTKQIKFNSEKKMFLGELSLNGELRAIKGAVSHATMAVEAGFKELFIPIDNLNEVSIIQGVKIYGVNSLEELSKYFKGETALSSATPYDYSKSANFSTDTEVDFADIKGQNVAKRAITIAASGGHNILLHGPPGTGKSMLAKSLSGILPSLRPPEIMELTRIYSIVRAVRSEEVVTSRPFRSPHHSASSVAIIGGGAWPRPGEITLAHRGVLFLDEFPEFPRNTIEALREPMENGEIVVSRAASSVTFPSQFMLVAAMNPCPCGNYGDEKMSCMCTAGEVIRYRRKISGPLLDRMDLHIPVPRETYETMSSENPGAKSSADIRSMVLECRDLQDARYSKIKTNTNSRLKAKEIHSFCVLEKEAAQFVKKVVVSGQLSGRAYHKILKVARTIADLEQSEKISAKNIAEAASYRNTFDKF